MDKNIKIKLWFMFYVNKKQFLFIYTIIALLTILLAVFSYYFPIDANTTKTWFGHFYAKNAVVFWLGINLYSIIEGLFFWNYFYKEQIKIINKQKEEIESQKEEIENQRDSAVAQKQRIEFQNKQIKASIQYAKRIQQAVLPDLNEINAISDNFILFLPRDIVSGDFYWFKSLEINGNKIDIVAAADCTGHGVPGAFVSILGISLLNEIVSVKKIIEPDKILNELRAEIKKSLHQQGKEKEQQDGMDISLVAINSNEKRIKYSGANNPVYIGTKDAYSIDLSNKKIVILDNGKKQKLVQIKPDKMPVGIYSFEREFSCQTIKYNSNDILYLFSDGYIDQFGGEKGEKFMSKRFKKFILDISDKEMIEQRDILESTFMEWKKDRNQLDDILVIGIKLT